MERTETETRKQSTKKIFAVKKGRFGRKHVRYSKTNEADIDRVDASKGCREGSKFEDSTDARKFHTAQAAD